MKDLATDPGLLPSNAARALEHLERLFHLLLLEFQLVLDFRQGSLMFMQPGLDVFLAGRDILRFAGQFQDAAIPIL